MRRGTLVIIVLLSALLGIGATPRKRERPTLDRQYPGSVKTGTDIHIVVQDTATTSSWDLDTRKVFTFMTTSDTLRIRSNSESDSAYITLYGMKASDSTNVFETLRLSGADTVFGTVKFLRFEAAVSDTTLGGIVSIYSKTGGLLTIIDGSDASTQTSVALHYTGKFGSGLCRWFVEQDTINATNHELRFYPFYEDVQDSTAGYVVLDQTRLRGLQERTHEFNPLRDLGAPLRLDRLGAVAVFSQGTVSTRIWNVEMDVYDRSQ